jgi:hypothetical protein
MELRILPPSITIQIWATISHLTCIYNHMRLNISCLWKIQKNTGSLATEITFTPSGSTRWVGLRCHLKAIDGIWGCHMTCGDAHNLHKKKHAYQENFCKKWSDLSGSILDFMTNLDMITDISVKSWEVPNNSLQLVRFNMAGKDHCSQHTSSIHSQEDSCMVECDHNL